MKMQRIVYQNDEKVKLTNSEEEALNKLISKTMADMLKAYTTGGVELAIFANDKIFDFDAASTLLVTFIAHVLEPNAEWKGVTPHEYYLHIGRLVGVVMAAKRQMKETEENGGKEKLN